MKIKLSQSIQLYNFCEPYVIAELASNHNGEISLAKKLVHAAKEAGANCVKFQSWTENTIFSKNNYEKNYFLQDDYRKRKDYSLKEIVSKFAFTEEKLIKIYQYCKQVDIEMISTPFSKQEVDFLVDRLQIPFIKIASMDINNYPFLAYVANKKIPIVLSTGLSTLDEIDKAIQTIENEGNNQIIILHCISNYPPNDSEINLNRIETFQKLYPYPVGFSDHTLGYTIPLAAVAKGACLIEKHLTLDKNMFGWDHSMSISPEELKTLVLESKRIHKALGDFRITRMEPHEKVQAFRRSIVLSRDLKKGSVLTVNDLDFKRPGIGIQPGEITYLIGRKIKTDLEYDHIISWDDLVK